MNQTPTPSIPAKSPNGHTSALASLICGVVSLICGALPAAIAAIILGKHAKKQGNTSASAKAGYILGIVGTILSALAIVVGILVAMLGGLGDAIYSQVTGLEFIKMESGNYAVSATDKTLPSHLEIPDSYKGKPVTVVAPYAFKNHTEIENITLPESVTRISTDAFSGCSALEQVNIPESVVWIDRYAFFGCNSLTEVDLPDGLTRLGSYAFKDCSSLTSITIPAKVSADEKGSYWEWQSIFENCTSLTTATLNNDCPVVAAMFKNCTSLTEVHLSPAITVIGREAFMNCTSLTSFTFHEGLETIGYSAFENCGLTEIHVPDTVTTLDKYAFKDCTALTHVTLSANIENGKYAYAFKGCHSIIFYRGSSIFLNEEYNQQNVHKQSLVTLEITGIPSGDYLILDNIPSITEVTISCISTDCGIYVYDAPNLSTIHFKGTKEQWRALFTNAWYSLPLYLKNKLTVRCSDGDIVYRPM